MKNHIRKPLMIRVLASVATIALVSSLVYVLVIGFNFIAMSVVAVAIVGLCVPSIMTGGSIMEMIAGFFEMFIEGFKAIIEGIADLIGSILN